MSERLLLHGLVLLFACVSALTLAGGFLRLRVAGLIIGVVFAVGGDLLIVAVWSLALGHDQKIFLIIPFLVVQFFALVSSYRFLKYLAGSGRNKVLRLFILGIPSRRLSAILLYGHLRMIALSLLGDTLLLFLLRVLLAAGIIVLATRILPLLWAVLLLPLTVVGWTVSFAFVVSVVIKFWEEKRSLPRIS